MWGSHTLKTWAVNNRVTAAQVRKCAPSLTNTNDMGRPKEFSGKDRGVHNMEFVLQHMHEMFRTRTSQEANDTVANSRKNPPGGVATT